MLAEAVPGRSVIINADSQQVYPELRVLTARPSVASENRVPHRLYGHRRGAKPYSVVQWRDEALAAIAEAERGDCVPIVVGGTGLYFRALLGGIAEVPDIPVDIRAEVRERLDRVGSEALYANLIERDAEAAALIAPSDGQRVARALEVIEATDKSLRAWQRDAKEGPKLEPAARVVLWPDRAVLHQRIAQRFEAMIEGGAINEVAALNALGLDPALPVMKALGVRELTAYLTGEVELKTAVEKAETATRRFAKRQMTWFRNQMQDWTSVKIGPSAPTQQMERIFEEIFPFIR